MAASLNAVKCKDTFFKVFFCASRITYFVLAVVLPIIPIVDLKCASWMLRADVNKCTLSYPAKHATPIYTTIGKFCVFQCDYVLSPARPLSVDSWLKGIL